MSAETSIVIRTLNEAKNLEKLMVGIHNQNYKDWEIVLVDSGSSDGTLEIAERFGCRIFHIPKNEFTFGRSLNIGCDKSLGDFLVFASGHVWPITNNWLGNLVAPFKDPAIAMVYGRQRGTKESRLPEIRDLHVNFGLGSTILVDEAKGNNGNAAIRRNLWLNQPFDESLPGLEDVDWARKAQRNHYQVYYAANAAVYHFHEETLKQVYIRSLREAIAIKRMFPAYQYSMIDLLRGLPYFILRDILFGLRTGDISKLGHVPATRLAHLLGIYKGVRFHKGLAAALLSNLETPQFTNSVVIEKSGNHQLKELRLPDIGTDEVLVKVAYAVIGHSDRLPLNDKTVDSENRLSGFSAALNHGYSGIVLKTGSKVRGVAKGQKVVGVNDEKRHNSNNQKAAYSEYIVCPGVQVRQLPWNIPLSYGALTETLAKCIGALRLLNPEASLKACVIGAGSIGNLCVQILSANGLKIVSVDPNPRWLSMLDKYDVDTLTEIGSLYSYDYFIETTGSCSVLTEIIENSSPSAKILCVCADSTPISVSRYSAIMNSNKIVNVNKLIEVSDWENAINMISKSVIRLDDHTTEVEPLESYEKAWDDLDSGNHFSFLLNLSKELESL